MVDIKHYIKLFFNEETGKERYGLIQKEAEIFCKITQLKIVGKPQWNVIIANCITSNHLEYILWGLLHTNKRKLTIF